MGALPTVRIVHPELGECVVNADEVPEGAEIVGQESDGKEPEDESEGYDFSQHTVPQLRKMLDKLGIDGGSLKKEELVAALEKTGWMPEGE